ncbi:hypothetical protein V6N11_053147 [Hibiscus sabdariffa]|uniref:Uncharacterized protein n=1 Tax=Hibiscus sabdariffa TaxID=183260 RepID=A0ABR2UCE1_9ROSI
MDREHEEMQFLGVFGIFKESYKLIFSCRKIFTNITLALILPLSFIYLVHVQVSSVFSRNIIHKNYEKLSDLIFHEWIYLWFFNVVYFSVFFVFSLPSTAAVVYTIAGIYTGRELTFNKIMSFVPKIWKRLLVNFSSINAAMFIYQIVALVVLFIWSISVGQLAIMGDEVLAILVILIIVGLLHLTTIWHLAGIVTVLEETIGFPAMVKSKNLVKGKLWLAVPIFVILNLAMWLHHIAFQGLVVEGTTMGLANRVVYAIICFLLLSITILFGLEIQTVIYFVCKSYHHENIDKSVLSDRMDTYLLRGYSPLKANDVQLFHVILVRT